MDRDLLTKLRALRERLDSGLISLQLGLGLLLFLPVAALLLAEGSRLPSGRLFVDMAAWSAAIATLAWLLLRLATYLRKRWVGDQPPAERVTGQDLLAHAVCLLLGPMLLHWFLPRLTELHPESLAELWHELRLRWVDGLLVAVGAWLCLRPVIAFFHYTTRR